MQSGWPRLGPLQWSRYVGKQVSVTVTADRAAATLRGWLLTVDPVSASLVLVNFRDVGGASVQLLMGHAVERLDVVEDADPQTAARLQSVFASPPSASWTPEELRRRREAARSWLEQNRVPVEEDGEALTVAGALTLDAPYGAEDCNSSNQIILDRIQRLLRSCPDTDTDPDTDPDPDADADPDRDRDPDPCPTGTAASAVFE